MKIPRGNIAKRHLAFGALFVLILASIPAGYVEAGFWDWVKENVVAGIFATFISALILIPGLIFWVVGGITQWFIGIVLSIPIIPQAGAPPFVEQGWNLLRGLANMVFLLILVFIGLATILRLREYELQRTLPRLIIAALLVNFSAVLVGLVVDLANLVANAFLSQANLNLNLFEDIWKGAFEFQRRLADTAGDIVVMFVAGATYTVFMWVFFLLASLVYLAVFLILLLRTLILWLLVILAPLAFAAAVLPATRGLIWNRWWGSLLQWSLVIIPISFFLWLSKNVMVLDSQDLFSANNPQVSYLHPQDDADVQGTLATFLGNIMGPAVGIIILLAGITISMAMAPGSIRAVGNFTRKAAIVTTGILGYKALSKLAESKKVRGAITRGSVAESRLGYKYNQATGEWEQKKSAWGAFQRRVGGVTGYTRRAAFGVAEKQVIERQDQREAQQAQKLRGRNANAYMQALRQEGSESGRAAILAQAAQEGKLRAMMDEDAMGGAENTLKAHEVEKARLYAEEKGNEDLQDAIDRGFVAKETGRRDDAGDLVQMQYARRNKDTGEVERDASGNIIYDRRNETWADRFAQIKDRASADAFDPKDRTYGSYSERDVDNGLISREEFDLLKADVQAGSPQRLVGNRGYSSKIIAGATSAEDIRQLQRRWQENDLLMEDVHRYWKGNQANAATQQIGRRFLHRLETTRKHGDWYFEIDEATGRPRNIAMAQWEASTGAQNLGVTAKEGAETTNEVRNKARIANNLANIQDATIRGEVKGILDEMTVLDNKREVMDVLAQDPDLRDVFQGIPKENEQARHDVARAINQIRDTSQWRDIGDILKANPELHHVSQQLAGITDTTQRREVADMLGKIKGSRPEAVRTRSGVADVLQENTRLVNDAGLLVDRSVAQTKEAALDRQIKRQQDALARAERERKQAEEAGVDPAMLATLDEEVAEVERRVKVRQTALKNVRRELGRGQEAVEKREDAIEAEPKMEERLPQWNRLKNLLEYKPGHYEIDEYGEEENDEDDDTTGGAAPTGGGGPTGGGTNPPPTNPPNTGGGTPGGGGSTPPPVAGGSGDPSTSPSPSGPAPTPGSAPTSQASQATQPPPTPPPSSGSTARPTPPPSPNTGSPSTTARQAPQGPPKDLQTASPGRRGFRQRVTEGVAGGARSAGRLGRTAGEAGKKVTEKARQISQDRREKRAQRAAERARQQHEATLAAEKETQEQERRRIQAEEAERQRQIQNDIEILKKPASKDDPYSVQRDRNLSRDRLIRSVFDGSNYSINDINDLSKKRRLAETAEEILRQKSQKQVSGELTSSEGLRGPHWLIDTLEKKGLAGEVAAHLNLPRLQRYIYENEGRDTSFSLKPQEAIDKAKELLRKNQV